MEDFLRAAHSDLRWAALVALLATIGFGAVGSWRRWGRRRDTKIVYLLTTISLDVQIVVGIILYILSPQVGENSYYTILHPLGMLVALAIFHLGSFWSKRYYTSQLHLTMLVTGAATLAVVVAFVPWNRLGG